MTTTTDESTLLPVSKQINRTVILKAEDEYAEDFPPQSETMSLFSPPPSKLASSGVKGRTTKKADSERQKLQRNL